MNWLQLCQSMEPSINADVAEVLLWNNTCFPFGPVKTIYKQLNGAIRAGRNGRLLCECCSSEVAQGIVLCRSCADALSKPHPNPPPACR